MRAFYFTLFRYLTIFPKSSSGTISRMGEIPDRVGRLSLLFIADDKISGGIDAPFRSKSELSKASVDGFEVELLCLFPESKNGSIDFKSTSVSLKAGCIKVYARI